MPKTYGRKVSVPKANFLEDKYCCPTEGCQFSTVHLRSYKFHFKAKHLPYYFPWMCDICEAGFKRKYDCYRHQTSCSGSREANNNRQTRKMNYVVVEDVPAEERVQEQQVVRELMEEEEIEGLKTVLEQKKEEIEWLKERLGAAESILEEKSEEIEMLKLQLNRKTVGDVEAPPRAKRIPKAHILKQERIKLVSNLSTSDDSKLGLTIKTCLNKGKGIKTKRLIRKNEYVVEYVGELLKNKAAKAKHAMYTEKDGSYMYFFRHRDATYCIDATADDQRYGRLINHSRLEPNLRGKVATVNNVPRLYFVANKDIEVGTELQFDYGDRNPETVKENQWLGL